MSSRSVDGLVETLQRERLEQEGVVFDARGRVPMARFRWKRGVESAASRSSTGRDRFRR